MTEDLLKHLLLDADAAAPRITPRDDLRGSVRRRLARRTVMRRGAIACAMVFLTSAVFFTVDRSRNRIAQKPISPRDPASQLATLSVEARLHEMTANKMLAIASIKNVPEESISPLEDVQLQRDRAALMLVYQANQHASEKRTDLAIAGYRRTIDLFPQTHWADVARQRLHELQT